MISTKRSFAVVLIFWGLSLNTELLAQDFWQQTNRPYGSSVGKLAINSNGHVFAATATGVFRSIDYGDSWMQVNSRLSSISVESILINSNGDIFISTNGGISRSTNNGSSWNQLKLSTGLTSLDVRALAINSKGHVFVLTSQDFFRSIDNGDTWTVINTGLSFPSYSQIAINGDGHIFAGGDGIFRSLDNGDTWTKVFDHPVITSLVISPNGYIFAGSNGPPMVSRSVDNGNSWTATDLSSACYVLATDKRGYIFAGNFDMEINRSIDYGDNWTSVSTHLEGYNLRSLAIGSNGQIFAVASSYYCSADCDVVFRGFRSILGDTPPPTFVSYTPPQIADLLMEKEISIPVTSFSPSDSIRIVKLYYRVGGQSVISVNMASVGNRYQASIAASNVTEKGVEFYILVEDNNGSIARTPKYSLQVNVPNGITSLEPQPYGSKVNAYRLVSIPLILDNAAVSKFIEANPGLGAYNKKVWRMYDFNRTTKRFVEFPNFSFSPDRGYLLIVDKPNIRLKSSSGKTVKTAEPYRISLPQGWSIIGNPFNYDIPRDSVVVTNGNLEIYALANGSWSLNISGLKAWEGYAVWVSEPSTLLIKAGKAGLSQGNNLFDIANSDEKNWLIQIKAKLNNTEDTFNFVGQNESATNHYDRMDLHKAPEFGGDIRLEISHPDWQEQTQETFTTDIRQANAAGQFYDFDVLTTAADGVGTLSFAGIEKLPKDYLVYLVDKAGKTSVNLRNNPEHHFAPVSSSKKSFRLLIGKREFIAQNSEGVDVFPNIISHKTTQIHFPRTEPSVIRQRRFSTPYRSQVWCN